MSNFIKPALLGLGLVAGLALTAQAQTAPGPSVATLPPAAQGPRASSYLSIPSGEHVADTGHMPPRFEKSADWDANPAMKPYDAGRGPKPN